MRSNALFLLAAVAIAPPAALAYVDVELDSNRHVIGDSYVQQDDKLVIYRPSGAVEVNRANVRSIREREGSSADDLQGSSVHEPATPPVAAPEPQPSAQPPVKDLAERDREVGHRLILMRLDRLGAVNRGDDAAVKDFDKQIETLDAEHKENRKKLRAAAEEGRAEGLPRF